jgi:hypothetical protein
MIDVGDDWKAWRATYLRELADWMSEYMTGSAGRTMMARERFEPLGLPEGATRADLSLLLQDLWFREWEERDAQLEADAAQMSLFDEEMKDIYSMWLAGGLSVNTDCWADHRIEMADIAVWPWQPPTARSGYSQRRLPYQLQGITSFRSRDFESNKATSPSLIESDEPTTTIAPIAPASASGIKKREKFAAIATCLEAVKKISGPVLLKGDVYNGEHGGEFTALATLNGAARFLALMPEFESKGGRPPQPKLNVEVFDALCVEAGLGGASQECLEATLGISVDTIQRGLGGQGWIDASFDNVADGFRKVLNREINAEDLKIR